MKTHIIDDKVTSLEKLPHLEVSKNLTIDINATWKFIIIIINLTISKFFGKWFSEKLTHNYIFLNDYVIELFHWISILNPVFSDTNADDGTSHLWQQTRQSTEHEVWVHWLDYYHAIRSLCYIVGRNTSEVIRKDGELGLKPIEIRIAHQIHYALNYNCNQF